VTDLGLSIETGPRRQTMAQSIERLSDCGLHRQGSNLTIVETPFCPILRTLVAAHSSCSMMI
jgi:hypothetical protein